MGIRHWILGEPGCDNALYVEVNTGQSQSRLLFDCGHGCLDALSIAQVKAIDALFFSHFHIDHVAGFDGFLRFNFYREDGLVPIFGPVGAAEVIQHRLRGVTWNLVDECPGGFVVHEIATDEIRSHRFLTCEGFSIAHSAGTRANNGIVFEREDFLVEACLLHHGVDSIGYRVQEKVRMNVDTSALQRAELRPGPWMKMLKDPSEGDDQTIEIGVSKHRLGDLRAQLLIATPGSSIAYLTDFWIDLDNADLLLRMLRNCDIIVCENTFHDKDLDLAIRNKHLVSKQVAQLAKQANAKRLVLFHLSDRYTSDEWKEQLQAARSVFVNTEFPSNWEIGGNE